MWTNPLPIKTLVGQMRTASIDARTSIASIPCEPGPVTMLYPTGMGFFAGVPVIDIPLHNGAGCCISTGHNNCMAVILGHTLTVNGTHCTLAFICSEPESKYVLDFYFGS